MAQKRAVSKAAQKAAKPHYKQTRAKNEERIREAKERQERERARKQREEKLKKVFTVIVCIVLILALGIPTMAISVLSQ